MQRYLFPKWSNRVLPAVFFLGIGPGLTTAILGVTYYFTNKHVEVGYQPAQPVEFSHKLHAGDLGMDCRYCHNTVERAHMAAVPPTATCMNCHAKVRADSPRLQMVRDSYANDTAIPWVRVHNVPDYAYFDHSAHLAAGVGCSTCHGRVDQMPRVTQVQPLSMGWCLDCHRDPAPVLRKQADLTNMAWQPPTNVPPNPEPTQLDTGRKLAPPKHCSGCHR
ncbi:MAG: cytochrome c3 family protein [Myxococcota bacterium]